MMRKAWAELSRIEEVRDAARGWKSAGAIDAPTLAAIEAAYPDPRVRLHGFWRVLVFCLVSVITNALIWFIQPGSGGLFATGLVFGVLLAIATELLLGSRHAGTGADAATSFWAVTYLLVAAGDLLFRQRSLGEETSITLMIALVAVVNALAAWRWGYWLYAAIAVAATFVFSARLIGARPVWIVVGIAGAWTAWRALRVAADTPDHRRCIAASLAVCAAALYVAINLYSLDHRIVESLAPNGPRLDGIANAHPAAPLLRLLAGLATAVYPVVFLALGIRTRSRLLLSIGLFATALSAVTLRYYVHLAPLWVVLAGCGAVLVGAAIAIQRALRDRPDGEWRGLTAAPLYERERGGISPLAALVAHAAGGAAPAEAPERGGLTTGGGEFGGGGATGSY